MNKGSRTTLLIAVLCVLVGIAIIAAAIALTPGGFKKIWNDTVNTNNWESLSNFGVSAPGGSKKWNNAYSPDGEYTASADVKGIDIDWLSGKVTVKPYSGNEIKFSETAQKEITEDTALGWGVKNGIMYIQYLKTNSTAVGNWDPIKTLEVLVPQKLAESLDSLELDATSAEINVNDIKADDIEVDTSSGDIYLSNTVSNGLSVDASSGKVHLNGVTASRIDIDTSSGDVELSGTAVSTEIDTSSGSVSAEALSSGSFDISTSSGDINLAGEFDRLKVGTASGVVQARLLTYPEKVNIDTSSGSVTLMVPGSGGFTLDYDSGSGDLDCGVPVKMSGSNYIYGDGSSEISVDTGSGDLTVIAGTL